MRRGQVLLMDLFVSFFLLLSISYYLLTFLSVGTSSSVELFEQERLEKKAYSLETLLLKSSEWGVVGGPYVIDQTKLLSYDFSGFNFRIIRGGETVFESVNINSRHVIRRAVVFQGRPAAAEIGVA